MPMGRGGVVSAWKTENEWRTGKGRQTPELQRQRKGDGQNKQQSKKNAREKGDMQGGKRKGEWAKLLMDVDRWPKREIVRKLRIQRRQQNKQWKSAGGDEMCVWCMA